MLTIVSGRAGSGKTEYLTRGIRAAVERGEGGQILLVPDQYSHHRARLLAEKIGDELSLRGEVLTFSRLASRVLAETGGLADTLLDDGGRLLLMSLAVSSVANSLKIYGSASLRADFLSGLLDAADEFRACKTDFSSLPELSGPLGDKLADLSLICSAYSALLSQSFSDDADRMERLARDLPKSSVGSSGAVWIDGFSDFTAQELEVIAGFLRKGRDVTVALLGGGDEEAFFIPALTASRLVRLADSVGAPCRRLELPVLRGGAAEELDFLEANLFSLSPARFDGKNGAVELIEAGSPDAECEIAAARLLSWARDGGLRWREMAVAARGFEDYAPRIETVFARYGVPVFLNRRSDILQKPALSLVTAALDVINSGWDADSLLRCLKTGLAGLSPDEVNALENYILTWNLRGKKAWSSEWTRSPRGFGAEDAEGDGEKLAELNILRQRAAAPLLRYAAGAASAGTAEGQVLALYAYTEDVGLAESLEKKSAALRERGLLKASEEYSQLWDILTRVLEQCHAILGSAPMDAEEFSKLLKLVLSKYDVGTIPVSIDSVSAGDMTRSRLGDVKRLIVLGASEGRLPAVSENRGILTDSDRERLLELGVELTGGAEEQAARESCTMYSCLTLPTEALTLSYPKYSGSEQNRPSYIFTRIKNLLGAEVTRGAPALRDARRSALSPCLELAASGDGEALEVFRLRAPERLEALRRAAELPRGSLSESSVRALYGKKLNMSASRVDMFASCKFSYFMRYGLRARPVKKAELDAPQLGSFMHFVLEGVMGEVKALGGFARARDDELAALTKKYTDLFAETHLGGLDDRSGRFRFLFERLCRDVYAIVSDMAEELRSSDFEPMFFELSFGGSSPLPAPVFETEGGTVAVSGTVDRVDGWVSGGKLYLRVVDYKTGQKKFDLSDVWYGLGMQMLIYLFTLQKEGAELFGKDTLPAGVLYAPARDVLISAKRSSSEESVKAERAKKLIRSGLILADEDVINAMEHGDKKKYLPVKFSSDGGLKPENVATLEQLGKLGGRIESTLRQIGRAIGSGEISADPFTRSNMSPCDFCDYRDACLFDEEKDRRRRLLHMSPDEFWGKLVEEDKHG